MKRVLILILGLILMAILSYFCFTGKSDGIRDDLVTNVSSALDAKKLDWVTPSVMGVDEKMTRIITLKGVAPSEEMRAEAQRVAESIDGVSSVDNQLILKQSVEVVKVEEEVSSSVGKVVNIELPDQTVSDEVFPIEAEIIVPPAAVIHTRAPEMKIEKVEEKKPVVVVFSCQDEFRDILSSSKINFESSKSKINSDSYDLLDSLVDVSKNCPNDAIAIGGHTDSSGSESLNQKLSANRASAVKEYLIGHGVSQERLISIGYGEAKPISDNSTQEGRATNRRIEFEVIDMEKLESLKQEQEKEKIIITSELKEITSIGDVKNKNIDLSNIPLAKTTPIDAQSAKSLGAATLGQSFEDVSVRPMKKYKRYDREQVRSYKIYQNQFYDLLRSKKIAFTYNKATIKPDSFDLLDKFAKIIRECNNCTIAISGYTDSDGSASFNKRLSLKRANAVKAYLIKKGVASDKLETVGYGGKNPIADNSTKEGKEKNRRIEFHIKGVR